RISGSAAAAATLWTKSRRVIAFRRRFMGKVSRWWEGRKTDAWGRRGRSYDLARSVQRAKPGNRRRSGRCHASLAGIGNYPKKSRSAENGKASTPENSAAGTRRTGVAAKRTKSSDLAAARAEPSGTCTTDAHMASAGPSADRVAGCSGAAVRLGPGGGIGPVQGRAVRSTAIVLSWLKTKSPTTRSGERSLLRVPAARPRAEATGKS